MEHDERISEGDVRSRVCDKCEKPFPDKEPMGVFTFRRANGKHEVIHLRWSISDADLCPDCLNPLWKEVVWK